MTGFLCYLSETGEDEVFRWYTAQNPEVRAAVFAIIETLRYRPYHHWRRKPFGVLRGGPCAGLGELRIEKPRGVHYRVLGCLVPSETAFILLYAFDKDSDPEYRIACPEAQKRRSEVERNGQRIRDCPI